MLDRCLLFALCLLCCAPSLSGQGPAWKTSPEGFRYSLLVEPGSSSGSAQSASSSPGLAIMTLSVEGMSASGARLAELELEPGLELESESLRPRASASPSRRGLELRLELRAAKAGRLEIKSLVVEAAEGRLKLGPILVIEGKKMEPTETAAQSRRWLAPPSALRYEAFEVRLEGSSSSFSFPAGVSAEATGPGSWTLIAFEGKSLSLPRIDGAQAQTVRIDGLPPALGKSRAIGSFAFRVEGPEGEEVAGSTLRFRLVLEGRGNLPALILPEPELRLGSASLPTSSWQARRVDDCRAAGGSYVGSASLELSLVPPRAGELSLSFPPYTVLDPEKGLIALSVPPFGVRIGEAVSAKAAIDDSQGRRLALLLSAARGGSAPRSLRGSREALSAARALSSELGALPILLDPLPPFYFFAFPAAAVAIAGLALFLAAKARKRKGGFFAAIPFAALALCLALGVLSLVSALERKESYAVIWADRLSSVPSAKAELSIPIPRGSTGRLRAIVGSSPKYARLVLADGVEGWALLDSLYLY